jgi:glycosyltransferase involved in cell wall biosynthesis
MKLVFIIDSLGVGGKERRCIQLIKGLESLVQEKIHLILFDDIIGYSGVETLNVSIHKLNRKTPKEIGVAFRLYRCIKRIKPDIVLSWSLMGSFWLNLLSLFMRFIYISAYVANVNKPIFFSIGNIARLFSFRFSKYIIGNSKVGLKTYGVPPKKSVLIYNGFDAERINNLSSIESVRDNLDITTRFLLVMGARVSYGKDYQTYIDAAKLILKERDDVTFLAVGDGPLLNYYESQLSIYESKFIRFIGHRENIEEIVNASDICILCSESEGISNFVLESMALGKPVIASNAGGMPEIVNDCVTGFLVEKKNKLQLKTKVIELLNDDVKRIRFGENSLKSVSANFTLNNMCNQFYSLFEKCMLE